MNMFLSLDVCWMTLLALVGAQVGLLIRIVKAVENKKHANG